MKSKIIILTLFLVGLVTLTACSQTDVIGKVAKTSFRNVIHAVPELVTEDVENGGWSLSAPDNSARFIWSKDYSKSPMYDVMLEFDAKPFIQAGLDESKLPEGIVYQDKIIVGTKLGEDQMTYNGNATPEASFDKIVNLYRSAIGYHEDLEHYGIDLRNGNKFEWAKDRNKNDKDIVFVVDPEIFIQAGVNPKQVEGWVYASVKVKDERGKMVQVKKFLKPFNLK